MSAVSNMQGSLIYCFLSWHEVETSDIQPGHNERVINFVKRKVDVLFIDET